MNQRCYASLTLCTHVHVQHTLRAAMQALLSFLAICAAFAKWLDIPVRTDWPKLGIMAVHRVLSQARSTWLHGIHGMDMLAVRASTKAAGPGAFA